MSHVYILFGKGGLVGNAFASRLGDTVAPYRLFCFDRPKADISNKAHVSPLFKFIKPTIVINCAAVNDIEMCEEARTGAFTVNSVGPEVLAAECKKHGAKLVHISACTVFDGKRSSPYGERCATAPLNVHGQSKLEGERAAARAWTDILTIRPGWAFNYEGSNPVTEWIALADRNKRIVVPGGHHGSPTYLPDMVDAVLDLINKDAKGVYHIANGEAASWESFAAAVVTLSGARTGVVPAPGELKTFRAPMPRHSVLSTRKYSTLTGKKMRPWLEALKECLFEMHRYKP